MRNYRLFLLDGAGRIAGADWLEAQSDDDARARALDAHGARAFELWDRYRLVERANLDQD
ncbi:MAG TPA: hypothetical protein VIK68_01420 [Sphingomicrobium sp.]